MSGGDPLDELRLASQPGAWEVTLTGGEVLEVMAHGYAVEDGQYVFSLLFEGRPAQYRAVLRIPEELVETAYGG